MNSQDPQCKMTKLCTAFILAGSLLLNGEYEYVAATAARGRYRASQAMSEIPNKREVTFSLQTRKVRRIAVIRANGKTQKMN